MNRTDQMDTINTKAIKPLQTALRNGLSMPAGYRSVEAFYRMLRLYTEGGNKDNSKLMAELRTAYPEINFS